MEIAYLATPYSDSEPKVMQYRFETVTRVAGELIAIGIPVFSSITHGHPIAQTHPKIETGFEA